MGTTKQLLPVDHCPAIVRCIENIRDSGVDDIVVVVGPEGAEIVKVLKGLPVAIAVNDLPESDMAASVRAGLSAVDSSSTGVFVCLCDHPLVLSATLKAMAGKHAMKLNAIIIPMFRGRKGHPTLFPRFVLDDIKNLVTLRDVINCHKEKILFFNADDEGVVLDMDTPEDYQIILDRCRS